MSASRNTPLQRTNACRGGCRISNAPFPARRLQGGGRAWSIDGRGVAAGFRNRLTIHPAQRPKKLTTAETITGLTSAARRGPPQTKRLIT